MIEGELVKVVAKNAVEICSKLELDEDVQQLLRDDLTPVQFLDMLIEGEYYTDATRFLAHALPKREATWWACVCTRSSLKDKLSPELEHALAIAEQWVYEPTDDHRKLALPAAEATNYTSPASLAAAAAGWSGGSLTPDGSPVVPPPEELTGHAVFGAVMLSGASAEPEKINETYRRYLEQGIDIAKGGSGRLE